MSPERSERPWVRFPQPEDVTRNVQKILRFAQDDIGEAQEDIAGLVTYCLDHDDTGDVRCHACGWNGASSDGFTMWPA